MRKTKQNIGCAFEGCLGVSSIGDAITLFTQLSKQVFLSIVNLDLFQFNIKHTHTHTHTHIYIYIYVYLYMCICVDVYMLIGVYE